MTSNKYVVCFLHPRHLSSVWGGGNSYILKLKNSNTRRNAREKNKTATAQLEKKEHLRGDGEISYSGPEGTRMVPTGRKLASSGTSR